jgi:hypothetical protein
MYKMIKQYFCNLCGHAIKAATYKKYLGYSRQCLEKIQAKHSHELQDFSYWTLCN